jgi:hypothetical protein
MYQTLSRSNHEACEGGALMSARFETWQEAHAEAAALATRTKLDVAIRAVREYGKLGFNVGFASKNDSDYARAEIVRPGDPR